MAEMIKIDDPQGLSIALEIEKLRSSLREKHAELRQKYQSEMDNHITYVTNQIRENYERLRLHLNQPMLINPDVDGQYAKLGFAVLHHGSGMPEDTTLNDILKDLGSYTRH